MHPAGWRDVTYADYGILRREPVPYPTSTPYKDDPTANGVYLHGFSVGWDDGLRGFMGLRSTPFELPAREDTDRIWRQGYNAGLEVGVDKLLQYKMYPAKPQGGANGKQPIRSEANGVSSAAASRRSP